MADPTPIQQLIQILADTKGAAEVAAALKQVEASIDGEVKQTERSVQAARRKDQQSSRLAAKLRELTAEQIKLEPETREGVVQDERAASEARRREQQVERLSKALAVEEDRQEELNRRVKESVNSHRAAAQATDQTTVSSGKFSIGLDGVLASATRLAGGLVGVGGLLLALRLIGEELREDTEAAREFQEAFLNLQFLNTDFNEQEKKFVQTASVFGGRTPAETATAYAELKSFFPNKADDELQELFLQVAETGRTTNAGLSPLTSAFAGIYQQTGDAQQSQNILRETLVQAGSSDPATISRALGKFLAPGQGVGGLSTAQSAGLVAGATGLDTRNPEEQITGLRTILLRLLGAKSDEQEEIVQRGGIDTTDFLTAIDTFGQAVESGRLSREDIERLVGGEAITTATALANPELRVALLEKVQSVVDASNSPEDLTAQAIQNQFAGDEASAINFALKQEEARGVVLSLRDSAPSRHELARLNLDNQLRSAGIGPVGRGMAAFLAQFGEQLGLDPESAIQFGGESVQFGSDEVRGAIEIAQNRTELQAEGVVIDNDGIDVEDAARRMADRIERERAAAPSKRRKLNKITSPDDELPDLFESQSAAPRILNQGTLIINAGDPLTDDLHGRDRFA